MGEGIAAFAPWPLDPEDTDVIITAVEAVIGA